MAILTPPVPITPAPPVQLTGGGYVGQGTASRTAIEQAKIEAGGRMAAAASGSAADVVRSRVAEKGQAGQLERDQKNDIFAQYLEQAKLTLAQDANETSRMEMLLNSQDRKAALEQKLGPKPEKALSPEASKYAALSKEGLGAIETLRMVYGNMSPKDRLQSEDWVPGFIQNEKHQQVLSSTQSLVESIGRLHSGAAITDTEWTNFRKLIPKPFDKPKTVESKLDRLKTQMSDVYSDINTGRKTLKEPEAGLQGSATITDESGRVATIGNYGGRGLDEGATAPGGSPGEDRHARALSGRYGKLVPAKPGTNTGQRTYGQQGK